MESREPRGAVTGEPQGPLRAMRLSTVVRLAGECVVWVFLSRVAQRVSSCF